MKKPIVAMIVALSLLAASEWSLRRLLATPPTKGLPSTDPIVILLGTSRTQAALSPAVIEATLRDEGIAHPWVANVSRTGMTMVGLYQLYMNELRPLLRGRRGLLAIEARPSGLNDRYLTEDEYDALATGALRQSFATGDVGEELKPRNALASWLRRQLRSFRLANGRDTLRQLRERLASDDVASFTLGTKGFEPQTGERPANLDFERWRYHYEEVIFREFHFGDVQLVALQILIDQIKSDGFEPLLYILPVTPTQRRFWNPVHYQQVITGLRAIANNHAIPLLDFDQGHSIPDEQFFDAHHVGPVAANEFSARFARDALAPRLR